MRVLRPWANSQPVTLVHHLLDDVEMLHLRHDLGLGQRILHVLPVLALDLFGHEQAVSLGFLHQPCTTKRSLAQQLYARKLIHRANHKDASSDDCVLCCVNASPLQGLVRLSFLSERV